MENNSHSLDSDKMQGKDTKESNTVPMDAHNLVNEELPSSSKDIKKKIEEKVVFNAVELMALGSIEQKYLLNPIFPQIGTAVLAGKPDIGKSQFARQLCIHVALGEETFIGFKMSPIHKRAIYVATEDNQGATTSLVGKQFQGLNKKVVENLRFLFAETLEQKEIIKELDKALSKEPADLVIVDSFGDVFVGGDSNNNMAMRNTVKAFDKIAKRHKCLILFVHHINKAAYNTAPAQENFQGGSGLLQKVRLAIQLKEGAGNIRYLSVVKGNYCPKSFKENSIELIFSEENFLFTNSGKTVPTSSIGSQSATSKKNGRDKELEEITFGILSKEPLSHSDLVSKFCEITEKSEPTAKRVIKSLDESGFIEKIKAKYRLKNKADVDNTE